MNVGATVESEDDGEDFSIRASVSMELSLFQKEKGCYFAMMAIISVHWSGGS
jgi:hypothetical protein